MSNTKHSTKVPRSKARTAYGLLSDVCAVVTEEPKRLAMGLWLARADEDSSGPPLLGFPACGTVGCIGGWVEVLSPKNPACAETILGLDLNQSDTLFYDNDLCSAPGQQTASHARKVVSHIRKFQKKYRAQLLAKKIAVRS